MDGGFAAVAELPAATGCVITMTLVVPHAARSGEIASDVATTRRDGWRTGTTASTSTEHNRAHTNRQTGQHVPRQTAAVRCDRAIRLTLR